MYQDELLEQDAEVFLNTISKNAERIRESKGITKPDAWFYVS